VPSTTERTILVRTRLSARTMRRFWGVNEQSPRPALQHTLWVTRGDVKIDYRLRIQDDLLPSKSTAKPVMFPLGRARFETMPTLTGSPRAPITTGIELVACLAANAAGVPHVTIKSTGSATNSTAIAEYRSS
jgi:hypothetical protein